MAAEKAGGTGWRLLVCGIYSNGNSNTHKLCGNAKHQQSETLTVNHTKQFSESHTAGHVWLIHQQLFHVGCSTKFVNDLNKQQAATVWNATRRIP